LLCPSSWKARLRPDASRQGDDDACCVPAVGRLDYDPTRLDKATTVLAVSQQLEG
jgi:hypothetical protein